MKCTSLGLVLVLAIAACQQRPNNQLRVAGLEQLVEVLRDSVGINHIYAQNEHDLFFAQGYCAAKDRLFQFEVWRRQATGTVAEILGPDELKRDIGGRLFKFRGNLKNELNHYHPRGEQIITAFTDGVNAYIRETQKDTSLLTLEFKLLGITPGLWNPEDVISRHQGLLGNLPEEIRFARAVTTLGEKQVKELVPFEPGDPNLQLDPKIDKTGLFDSIATLYTAFRTTLKFKPEHLITAQGNTATFERLAAEDDRRYIELMSTERESIGSNNWIVSGSHSESGFPMLANDPHRAITAPSLRYMVHLNAPGWNVVGGGEPTIPGISIGHNEYGAWGLTIFNLDGEDIYVYKLNPLNHNQYTYKENWEDMQIENDTILVKGGGAQFVEHRFTRHGPVLYIDTVRHVAYAARCAWLDVGAAPYMASLRIDQARDWEEFREGCSFSRIPGENMIWIDTKGNIGWQAVGVAPIRKNYSGLVPVPGDGSYEWDGYLPILSLPSLKNPEQGFFATANENNVPEGYANRNAVGWNWADRFRVDRINEVLAAKPKHTREDMMKLQFDYLSLPARNLVSQLTKVTSGIAMAEQLRGRLLNWNFIMDKNSIEATVYAAWEKKLSSKLRQRLLPPEAQKFIRTIPLRKLVSWLSESGGPIAKASDRNKFLIECLEESVSDLQATLGSDPSTWIYGQEKMHHVLIKHPLSNAVDEATRKKLDLGPLPRGGYGATPGMTGNSNNQGSGASFRFVADAADWDKTMFTNAPGQSGDPDSPYYSNLFKAWATDKHVPVYFSKERILAATQQKLTLNP